MTIDQLRPDVGGPYRHRKSGRVYTLREAHRGVYYLWSDRGRPLAVSGPQFWRHLIHAAAGTAN